MKAWAAYVLCRWKILVRLAASLAEPVIDNTDTDVIAKYGGSQPGSGND